MSKIKILKNIKLLIILLAVLTVLSGCFFGTGVEKTVTPTIRVVGLPTESIIDSITLKVTGPDMDPVEVSYSQLPNVINIAIPEGNNMTFELNVGLSSTFIANPAITYTSLKGTATASINSDSAVVTLNMGVGSTKIIVPDTYNNRIVQIDDMSGTGWITLAEALIGTITYFEPVDVDFDKYGNFYIANNVGDITNAGIWKFLSISDNTPVRILSSGANGIKAVTIDRKNDRVYGLYNNGSDVVYYNNSLGTLGTLGSGVQFNFTSSNFSTINGITVDDEGNVYLCGQDGNSELVIEKYSLNGGSSIKTYVGGTSTPATDVTILDGVLYASIYFENSTPTALIDAFDPNNISAGPIDTFGSYNNPPSIAEEFFGPHNFIATMNNKLTVMDFDYYNGIGSRLVSFDDISGTGWITFGSSGPSMNEFNFISGGE